MPAKDTPAPTPAKEEDAKPAAAPAKDEVVNASEAKGGRYVSIGGGQLRRVADDE